MSRSSPPRAADELDASVYACPRTGAALVRDGDRLRSADGAATYPLQDGIPCFLAADPVETENDRARLRHLNETALRAGWRSALEATYGTGSGMVDYVTNPTRVRVLDLLELTADDTVLEIGPGLGQMTVELGRRCRLVHALEVVPEQAAFTRTRCRQEGLANVTLACGGDDCRLPYAAGRFDGVVANLVFEWCATRIEGEPFLAGQRRFLAEARRVLRPGGRLLLATKNRFALRYLLGKGDEHVGHMRFGNALPRPLLNWLLRRRGQARPAGLLHAHDALRRLLEEAGFAAPRSFWAAPEMRMPTHFIPTDAAAIRQARATPGLIQGEIRSTRLLMPWVPAPLVKHVTPGLLWVAEVPASAGPSGQPGQPATGSGSGTG